MADPFWLANAGSASTTNADSSYIWSMIPNADDITQCCTVAPTVTRAGTTLTRWASPTSGPSLVAANTWLKDYDPNLPQPLFVPYESRTNLLLNSLLDGTNLSTQSVTVTAVANTLSFYGTGTVTLSGVSTAGPLVGTGANNRVTLTFTPTAGTLTLTVSGTVKWANLEAGADATAFIPTAGSTVTRPATVCTLATASIPGFSATTLTMTGRAYANSESATTATNRFICSLDDGTTNNRASFFRATNATVNLLCVDTAATQAQISGGAWAANTLISVAGRWALNNFAISVNGSAESTDTSGTMPSSITTLHIGTGNTSIQQLHGGIVALGLYNTAKANLQLYSA